MPESPQNSQSDFIIIEKIKERPVNKKKLLRRTMITATMAVIFGLIACFTFLVLEPVISNWLYPEEEPQSVSFPEDHEEMSPEEMLADNMEKEHQNQQNQQAGAAQGSVSLEKEQIEEIISGVTLDLDNYKQLFHSLSAYVAECNQYMVAITAVTSNIDWFNNVHESEHQASGVIIANNGRELLILADYKPLEKAENINLTFHNGTRAEATVKEHDADTELAVVAVELSNLDGDFIREELKIASLGSSNAKNIVGTPIVALGSPMGTTGSLGYGVITAANTTLSDADTNYKLIQTDIMGSQNAGGVLFNLNGQIVGIITDRRGSSDMKNMISAYGITELKKRIEKMSNGEKMAYLGICGVDVTEEAHRELDVPLGAYITETEMDSPAMRAGIQQGDILVGLDEDTIASYSAYSSALMKKKAGNTVKVIIMRQVQEEYKEMEFEIVLEEVV